MERDPVCRMEIAPREARATSRHQGRTYYFCSSACQEVFDRHLELFAEPGIGEHLAEHPPAATRGDEP